MLDADPSLIRIVWAVLVVLTGGLALLVYIVMAIVVPERPRATPLGPAGGRRAPMRQRPARPRRRARARRSWRAPDGSTVPMARRRAASARRAARSADRDAWRPDRRPRAHRHRRLLPAPRVRPGLRPRAVVADRRRSARASAHRPRRAARRAARADGRVPYDGRRGRARRPVDRGARRGRRRGRPGPARPGLGDYRSLDPRRRHLDVRDRIAGRRRGPGQRRRSSPPR